jgi:hypothetical protein
LAFPTILAEARPCRTARHDLVVVAVDDQVGTSNFLRSPVKSVSENALMQSKQIRVPSLVVIVLT